MSREGAEKRKAESQDLRAHRKTAVWSQTRSARPPHTADELCPHSSPLPAPLLLLNVIHLLWFGVSHRKWPQRAPQLTFNLNLGSIYIRLMNAELSLVAQKVMRCAVIAGSGPVLLSYPRNINYCCFATQCVKNSSVLMINNKALFTFFLWLSELFHQNKTVHM